MPASHPPTSDELAAQDARFNAAGSAWWDAFYARRDRPVPFFVDAPDESLDEWLQQGRLPPGTALDMGCGNGRNAIRLARAGFRVDAVDYSREAVDWAARQAEAAAVDITLHHASVFDLALVPGSLDMVYDSGCFHHLPPHRRSRYVDLVAQALRPGGWFGLACFRPEGGSGLTDEQAEAQGTLGGGLGYSEAQLREIWSGPLVVKLLRPMRTQAPGSGLFGEGFLWALLAQKPA